MNVWRDILALIGTVALFWMIAFFLFATGVCDG